MRTFYLCEVADSVCYQRSIKNNLSVIINKSKVAYVRPPNPALKEWHWGNEMLVVVTKQRLYSSNCKSIHDNLDSKRCYNINYSPKVIKPAGHYPITNYRKENSIAWSCTTYMNHIDFTGQVNLQPRP